MKRLIRNWARREVTHQHVNSMCIRFDSFRSAHSCIEGNYNHKNMESQVYESKWLWISKISKSLTHFNSLKFTERALGKVRSPQRIFSELIRMRRERTTSNGNSPFLRVPPVKQFHIIEKWPELPLTSHFSQIHQIHLAFLLLTFSLVFYFWEFFRKEDNDTGIETLTY